MATSRARVTVTVEGAVQANNDVFNTAYNTPIIIPIASLLVNDSVNGEAPLIGVNVSFQITQQPTTGTLVDNDNGTLTYTPAPGTCGPMAFQYTLENICQDTRSYNLCFWTDGNESIIMPNTLLEVGLGDYRISYAEDGCMVYRYNEASRSWRYLEACSETTDFALADGQVLGIQSPDSSIVSHATLHQGALIEYNSSTDVWRLLQGTLDAPEAMAITIDGAPYAAYVATGSGILTWDPAPPPLPFQGQVHPVLFQIGEGLEDLCGMFYVLSEED